MAICADCKQKMSNGVGCTVKTYDDFPDGIERKRIAAFDDCHDCKAPKGSLHHPGCDMERCPNCGGQAISCDCLDEQELERGK